MPAATRPSRRARGVVSWWVTLVLGAVVLCAVVSIPDRHYLGRPVEAGTVEEVLLTGERADCGRTCSCDEALFVVRVDDGDLARDRGCSDNHEVGERVTVRRAAGRAEAQFDPVPLGQVVLLTSSVWALIMVVGWFAARAAARRQGG